MPRWEAWAADGTCYVLKDGELVEAFDVGKKSGDGIVVYFRTRNLLEIKGDEIRERLPESLRSMTRVADFENEFFYVRELGMDFNGLGAQVDAIGHLGIETYMSDEEVAGRRRAAQEYLDGAEVYEELGAWQEVKRQASSGLGEDPSNKALQDLFKKAVRELTSKPLEEVVWMEPIFNPAGANREATEHLVTILQAEAVDPRMASETRLCTQQLIHALKKGYEMQSGEKY